MRIRHAVALASVFTFAAFSMAGAQAAEQRIPIRYLSYVAADPIGIAVDITSLEIETAVAPGITAGGTVSYTSLDDKRFTSGDAVVRYYPGEIVLKGFSLGLSGGILKYSDLCCTGLGTRTAITVPTVGLALDYNWMLGGAQRFIVGTGLGAKRVLAGAPKRDQAGLDRAYGTARFVVGIAF